MSSRSESRYWRATRRLTIVLLGIWATLTFTVCWFAEDLNAYVFLGFPLGFYMAAQGQMLIFLALIWVYNRLMDRLEARYGQRAK